MSKLWDTPKTCHHKRVQFGCPERKLMMSLGPPSGPDGQWLGFDVIILERACETGRAVTDQLVGVEACCRISSRGSRQSLEKHQTETVPRIRGNSPRISQLKCQKGYCQNLLPFPEFGCWFEKSFLDTFPDLSAI